MRIEWFIPFVRIVSQLLFDECDQQQHALSHILIRIVINLYCAMSPTLNYPSKQSFRLKHSYVLAPQLEDHADLAHLSG